VIDGGGGGSADATVTGEGREDPADACKGGFVERGDNVLAFGLPGPSSATMRGALLRVDEEFDETVEDAGRQLR
jgi:hypothetical protein